jgi:hypothetical protein
MHDPAPYKGQIVGRPPLPHTFLARVVNQKNDGETSSCKMSTKELIERAINNRRARVPSVRSSSDSARLARTCAQRAPLNAGITVSTSFLRTSSSTSFPPNLLTLNPYLSNLNPPKARSSKRHGYLAH